MVVAFYKLRAGICIKKMRDITKISHLKYLDNIYSGSTCCTAMFGKKIDVVKEEDKTSMQQEEIEEDKWKYGILKGKTWILSGNLPIERNVFRSIVYLTL
jgi:hypothetical protein